MADPNHDSNRGVPPRDVHVEPAKKKNWLLWLLPLLAIVGLLLLLSQCGDDDREEENRNVAATQPVVPLPGETGSGAAAAPAVASGLAAYLAGGEALPRTFVFERLNFATGSSTLRPEDRDEVNSIATALKQYPNARVRLVGYADAAGSADANASLGKWRADGVKEALVAAGIDANRIETASGGEAAPVATNESMPGRAENRRTEIVALSR